MEQLPQKRKNVESFAINRQGGSGRAAHLFLAEWNDAWGPGAIKSG